jgi:hypothetical protein
MDAWWLLSGYKKPLRNLRKGLMNQNLKLNFMKIKYTFYILDTQ